LLDNFLTNLNDEWNFIIYCGLKNQSWVENIIDAKFSKYKYKITIKQLGVDNLTIDDYNELMTNIDFNVGFTINRENLDKYINSNTDYNSLLETSFGYTGVNIKIPMQRPPDMILKKLIWKNKRTKRNTIFSNDDDYNNLENNHNQYHYQYRRPNRYEYLHLKLNDLINPERNKTFIDNLYAQFHPDSKQINLIYAASSLQKMNQMPDNTVLLSNRLLDNKNYSVMLNNNNKQIDANKLLNEYYLSVLKKTSKFNEF
jgi:hypothetical protein